MLFLYFAVLFTLILATAHIIAQSSIFLCAGIGSGGDE